MEKVINHIHTTILGIYINIYSCTNQLLRLSALTPFRGPGYPKRCAIYILYLGSFEHIPELYLKSLTQSEQIICILTGETPRADSWLHEVCFQPPMLNNIQCR